MSGQALLKSEINTKKVEIIAFISRLEKVELLLQIEDLIKSSASDWWNFISDSEKEKIEEGLLDIKEGRTVPHDIVMKKAEEKIKSFKS
jgi:hypothetical protein